jgi:signal transduction histidine kinase
MAETRRTSGPRSSRRELTVFAVSVALAVAAGVAAFVLLMSPTSDEVLAMAAFLGGTAALSLAAGYAAYRAGWLRRSPRLVWTLVGGYLLAAILVFVNVAVTAGLMFLNSHDLLLATVLLLSASLIAVALGYLLSSAVADSVGVLNRAVEEVAEGDLDVVVPVEGSDELAELARGFNDMVERLRAAETQRDAMERSRRELVAAVGHDLRTPLASVRLFLGALADGLVQDPDTVDRYLRTSQHDLDTLSRLVDDLFTLSQLESGGVDLASSPNSLSDLISDTLASFALRAERKGVALKGAAEAEPDTLCFDALYIGRALSNLVDNALEHAPAGTTVTLRTRSASGGVEVVVSDEGDGVAPADLPHVFERFYRGDSSRGRATGGGGLGLAIVKSAVHAHGGEVAVSSVPGQGAEFSFTLPARAEC